MCDEDSEVTFTKKDGIILRENEWCMLEEKDVYLLDFRSANPENVVYVSGHYL